MTSVRSVGSALREPTLRPDFKASLREPSITSAHRRQVEAFTMFLGYGFSGHSMVGSLLNAHPDVLISHELDALRYVEAGFGRRQLFNLIARADQSFETRGRINNRYSYSVDGQWQGRVRRLQVIGDKKGGISTLRLADDPHLLDRLRAVVRVPLRMIHVIRSPLDIIASLDRSSPESLEACAATWIRQTETMTALKPQLDSEEYLEVFTEDFKTDPTGHLELLCRFLGVEVDAGFIEAAAAVVKPEVSRTRDRVTAWPTDVISAVAMLTERTESLTRYLDDVLAAPHSQVPGVAERLADA